MRVRRLAALCTVLGVTGAAPVACTGPTDGPSDERRDGSTLASAIPGHGWDFDGDGHQELVLEGPSARELRVYPGRPAGPGARAETLSAADLGVPGKHVDGFGDHASGDVNGDGYDDLVSCVTYDRRDEQSGGDHWSRFGVVLGSEQGLTRWVPMVPERRNREGCPAPVLADVDHDGYDDTVQVWNDRIRWTRGRAAVGADTTWEWRTIAKPSTVDSVLHRDFDDLMLGDFDGDDRVDLAYTSNGIATGEGEVAGGVGIWVRHGTEDGFGEPDVWVDQSERAVPEIGDVNGDGFDDLVTYEYERIRVRHGSGKGLAPPKRAVTLLDTGDADAEELGDVRFPSVTSETDQFEVVDLDSDGSADVVALAVMAGSGTPAPGELAVLPGGRRSGDEPRPYRLEERDPFVSGRANPPLTALRARDLADGEGTELVALWETNRQLFGYFFDRRDIAANPEGDEGEARPRTEAAPPWDFDGDGERSLVIEAPNVTGSTGGRRGAVAAFDLSGPGSPPEGERIGVEVAKRAGLFGTDSASGDFDADGFADLAVCTGEGMAVLFGSPDGLDEDEDEAVSVQVAENGHGCDRLEAADIDADGFDDLSVVASSSAGWMPGGPRTRSASGWAVHGLTDRMVRAAALGDVNGDERLDAVSYGNEGLVVALGGDEGFAGRAVIDESGTNTFELGDVNGDGFDDLAMATHEHEVVVWLGSRMGLGPEPAVRMTAEDFGVAGAESRFAADLAVDDSDGNGFAEVTIGAPGGAVKGAEDAGVVLVVPGSADGPAVAECRTIRQGKAPSSGEPESSDGFGARVDYRELLPAAGAELVVASPGEDDDEGKVQLFSSDGEVRQYRPEDAGIEPEGARFGGAVWWG